MVITNALCSSYKVKEDKWWGGTDHQWVINTLRLKLNVAKLFIQRAKYHEATPLVNEVYQGLVSKVGPSHPDTLRALQVMGRLCYLQGNFHQAGHVYRDLLPYMDV